MDRWLLARRDETFRAAAECFDRYEAGQARHEIDKYFWNDLCDTYIELCKERLYAAEEPEEKRAAQGTLYRGLLAALQLYAPFAPHITEAVYQELFRGREPEKSLHLTRWPRPDRPDEKLLRFGEALKAALSAMRKEKTERGLSLRAETDAFAVEAEEELFSLFWESQRDLLSCARAKELRLIPGGETD